MIASFAGSPNYASSISQPITFVIAQATPSVTVSDSGGTYQGTAYSASSTVTGPGGTAATQLEGVAPVPEYYAGTTPAGASLSAAPSQAGTYTVVADFPGSTDYSSTTSPPLTFVISQATPAVNINDAGGPYSGSAYGAIGSLVGVNGQGATQLDDVGITSRYFAGDTASGAPLSGAPARAGTYTVVASFAGSINYLAGHSAPLTFTITRATPSVNVSARGARTTAARSRHRPRSPAQAPTVHPRQAWKESRPP